MVDRNDTSTGAECAKSMASCRESCPPRRVEITDRSLAMSATNSKKTAFVFVCQGGRLEIESLLLAASLDVNLAGDYEMIAAIPTCFHSIASPRDETISILKSLNVRIEPIRNTILEHCADNRIWYHHFSNKVFCLRLPTDAERIFFVDSDHLLHDQQVIGSLGDVSLNLHTIDIASAVQLDPDWDAGFGACNVAVPAIRTRTSGHWLDRDQTLFTPAGCNGSMVGVDTKVVQEFCDHWEWCIRTLDDKHDFRPDRLRHP